jgi:hypothetical protein
MTDAKETIVNIRLTDADGKSCELPGAIDMEGNITKVGFTETVDVKAEKIDENIKPALP